MSDRFTRRFGRALVATIVLVAAALALTPRTHAASKIDGLWEAVIMSGGGPNASPKLEYDFLNTTLELTVSDRGTGAPGVNDVTLKGTYKNNSRPRGQEV